MTLKKTADLNVERIRKLKEDCEKPDNGINNNGNILSVLNSISDTKGKKVGTPQQSICILVSIVLGLIEKGNESMPPRDKKEWTSAIGISKNALSIIDKSIKFVDKEGNVVFSHDFKKQINDIFDAIGLIGEKGTQIGLECAKEIVNIGNAKWEQLKIMVSNGLKHIVSAKDKLIRNIKSKKDVEISEKYFCYFKEYNEKFVEPCLKKFSDLIKAFESGYFEFDTKSDLNEVKELFIVLRDSINSINKTHKYGEVKKIFEVPYTIAFKLSGNLKRNMELVFGDIYVYLVQLPGKIPLFVGEYLKSFLRLFEEYKQIRYSIGPKTKSVGNKTEEQKLKEKAEIEEKRKENISDFDASLAKCMQYAGNVTSEMSKYGLKFKYDKLGTFKSILDSKGFKVEDKDTRGTVASALDECNKFTADIKEIMKKYNESFPENLSKEQYVINAGKAFAKLDNI